MKANYYKKLYSVWELAMKSINEKTSKSGIIQLPCDSVFSALFYSDCNGAVRYNIAKIDGYNLLCVEEGQTWDENTTIDEEETDGITISAIMYLIEMDMEFICEFADFLNEYLNNEKTTFLDQYMNVYKEMRDLFVKKGGTFYLNETHIEDVLYIDENDDFAYATPIAFDKEYLVNGNGFFGEENVSYDRIPSDDFAKMTDNLISVGIL